MRYYIYFLILVQFSLHGCSGSDVLRRAPNSTVLQNGLEELVTDLGITTAVKEKRFGLAVADITDIAHPKYAGINQDLMLYAASTPKIAILFALYKRLEEGSLVWDPEYQLKAKDMIQNSSNLAATELFYLVGPEYIRDLLMSSEYKLYDISGAGGIWVGKEFGKGDAICKDPLSGLAHAATAYSLVKFYYMLEAGQLLSPVNTQSVKEILSQTAFNSKFVRGLNQCCSDAIFYRKAGGWKDYDSDSIMVERKGKRFIVAALAKDEMAEEWFEKIIIWISAVIEEGY